MIQLIRVTSNEKGTFGVLLLDGQPIAVTLEPPWKQNEAGKSCIPNGKYQSVRCSRLKHYGPLGGPKFGDTFEVTGVEGRSRILFHRGNSLSDTTGCILIASSFGDDGTVRQSTQAFRVFQRLTEEMDAFDILIRQTHS